MTPTKSKGKQHDQLPVQKLRDGFRDAINRVEFGGERIVITRHDKPAAALVSIQDLEKIEAA